MSKLTPSDNLNIQILKIKENNSPRQNIWAVKDSYYTDLKLNSNCAVLLTILTKLSINSGNCTVTRKWLNNYFPDNNKNTISKHINKLESLKLIYVHRHSSRRGIKLKIVSRESSQKHANYLLKGGKKCAKELKKFKEEFLNISSLAATPDASEEKTWYIPEIYWRGLYLSSRRAQTLTIFDKTGFQNSFSDITYDYIQKRTGVKSDKTTCTDIKYLQKADLLYFSDIDLGFGKKRNYVTHVNAEAYCDFLTQTNQFEELNKFKAEFMSKTSVSKIILEDFKGAYEPMNKRIKCIITPKIKKTLRNIKKELSDKEKRDLLIFLARELGDNDDDGEGESGEDQGNSHNIKGGKNRTSKSKKDAQGCKVKTVTAKRILSYYRINDDTEKAKKKDSDTLSKEFAVPLLKKIDENRADKGFKELEEDVLSSFSRLTESDRVDKVTLGMAWWAMQSISSKRAMINPAACIVKAIKAGYALTTLQGKDREFNRNNYNKTNEKAKEYLKKRDTQQRRSFASFIKAKCDKAEGVRCLIDTAGVSLFCSAAKKTRDPNSVSHFYQMPNGETHRAAGVRLNFSDPTQSFHAEAKEYLKKSNIEI